MNGSTTKRTSESGRDVRAEVLRTARDLYATGLVTATAGNVSGRMPDRTSACVTPSSIPYDQMELDDLVIVDIATAEVVDGDRSPTSELTLHLECYRRFDEVGGVVHSHPPYASMFAVSHEPIPAVIEEVVNHLGGDIPVCDYEMAGSDALGISAAALLGDRSAVLLANHGLVCIGADCGHALGCSITVEHTALIVWGANQLGRPKALPPKTVTNFTGVYRFVRAEMWSTGV